MGTDANSIASNLLLICSTSSHFVVIFRFLFIHSISIDSLRLILPLWSFQWPSLNPSPSFSWTSSKYSDSDGLSRGYGVQKRMKLLLVYALSTEGMDIRSNWAKMIWTNRVSKKENSFCYCYEYKSKYLNDGSIECKAKILWSGGRKGEWKL